MIRSIPPLITENSQDRDILSRLFYAALMTSHHTFFESYFSNYIEGTEFTLEEAEEIAFERKINYERHQDSHDVLSHIDISGDMSEMCKVPSNPNELIEILMD